MAELVTAVSENGWGHTQSRDAWVVDGFAPLPGDRVRLPVATPGGQGDTAAPASETAAPTSVATVQTVYLCSEQDGSQLVRWSWIVLEDGRLLEIAPRGCALYDPPTILARGSGRFLELAAQDGALVRFEERVRAGEWQDRPVRLTLQRRRWRISSTGTVAARRLGPAPAGGWSQLRTGASISPDTDRDVYFTLAGESDATLLGLGVWMTDIALAFGRRLGDMPSSVGLRVLSE
jgi:hypothetical protein